MADQVVVYKYSSPVSEHIELSVPKGAQLLSVADQLMTGHSLTFWALVDPEQKEQEFRHIHVLGTGHPWPVGIALGDHLGTVVTAGGALVWHVFMEA